MARAALAAAVFASSYLGCALLALRQRPHFRAVSAQPVSVPPSDALRARLLYGGGVSLALSLCCSWLAQGLSFGSLFWVLALGSTSVAVTFTLSWRPHWLGPVLRGVSAGSTAALDRN
ncbi:MAG TPA: DUF3325 domain-containing protein [Polyangiaceae bacterium]|nr:DUF3325 domain-containing protein [Polyangiaceae bacterium]